MLRRRLLVVLMCAGCRTEPPPSARSTRTEPAAPPAAEPADATERNLFSAVNDARRRHQVQELEWYEPAAEAARSHSRRMADKGFLSHDDPERGGLERRLRAASIEWRATAENLFQQRGLRDPVRAAVEGWLESKGHRRNLLNPKYTRTGIGIAAARDGTFYYTQIFLY